MSKIKVYLAKSNLCDPDEITKIRALLNSNKSIEVLEYRGGEYKDDDLKKSDYLVVLPYHESRDFSHSAFIGWRFFVGKGLYGQIQTFELLKPKGNILFMTGVEDGDMTYSNMLHIELHDSTDYKKQYGRVTLKGGHHDLRDHEIFAEHYKNNKISLSRYLLLCT